MTVEILSQSALTFPTKKKRTYMEIVAFSYLILILFIRIANSVPRQI